MPIEQIHVGNVPDDKLAVTITLKGDPNDVITALANGLPREALEKLRDALEDELQARAADDDEIPGL